MTVFVSLRDRRLDTMRGVFLVIMLIDHLGGYIAQFTYQPFGFVSAAEGFIFLSGMMFGQIYARYLDDPAHLRQRVLARAWLIYRYHLAMVLVIGLLALLPFFDELWYLALEPYSEAPVSTLLAMVALLHLPGYLDILPLYVLFVLLSPLVLQALALRRYRLVVFGSVGLWCLGQWIDPLPDLYRVLGTDLKPGYFNLFSWQILWASGLTLGYARLAGIEGGFVRQRGLLWLALAGTFVLWLWRREYVPVGTWLEPLIDKPGLGPLRLLNCILLMLIGWHVMNRFRLEQCLPFFELLGRYSIQVFSFHVVLLYLTQYTTEQVVRPLGHVWFTTYTLALVFSLLIPVVITRRLHHQPNVRLFSTSLS